MTSDETIEESIKTTDAIIAIGKGNGLHFDQIGVLSDVMDEVMDGRIPASVFEKSIRERVKLNGAVATKIAGEVNENIFKPAQASLRKMQVVLSLRC